jgi:hypothetical protein
VSVERRVVGVAAVGGIPPDDSCWVWWWSSIAAGALDIAVVTHQLTENRRCLAILAAL